MSTPTAIPGITIPTGTSLRRIPAQHVREGDFLAGLDNGYVIEAEEEDCRAFSGTYNVSLGRFVTLTFNTADGDEAYVLLPRDTPVTVARESQLPDVPEDADDDEDY